MTAPNHPTRANLTFNANGDNTIVAATAGLAIVVWKISFTIDAAGTIQFASGAGTGTPLSGAYKFTGAGSMVLDGPEGFELFRTTAGALLNAATNSTANVGGNIWYTKE